LGDTEKKNIFDSIVKSDLYERCIEYSKDKCKKIQIDIDSNQRILTENNTSYSQLLFKLQPIADFHF